MKAKQICPMIAAFLGIILFINGCTMQQRIYAFGDEFADSRITATMLSADFSDSISVNDDTIEAPSNTQYLIVNMDIAVINGKWDTISGFTVHINGQEDANFDQDLSNRLNEKDILKIDTTEKQSVQLVFNVDYEMPPVSFSLVIQYADGSCSGLFVSLPH